MSDCEVVAAVLEGKPYEVAAEDYPRVRCALLVVASLMAQRKQSEKSAAAAGAVAELDKQLIYDPDVIYQRSFCR